MIYEIKKSYPFILITGYSRLISPERCRKYGIHSVLTKPLVVKDLAVRVKKAIQK